MNFQSAAFLRSKGVEAYFFPLGYLEEYSAFSDNSPLPGELSVRSLPRHVHEFRVSKEVPLAERPIDIFFVGTLSERREEFFATTAKHFSNYFSFFHLPSADRPLVQGKTAAMTTQAVIGISGRSKILLNVHRDEFPYFEWARMVFHGFWQRTLVLTEPCLPAPGFVAGEHYLECSLSDFPSMIAWLLRTSEGMNTCETVSAKANKQLREQFPLERFLYGLANHIMTKSRC